MPDLFVSINIENYNIKYNQSTTKQQVYAFLLECIEHMN